VVLTILYTMVLKHEVILDVMSIAAGFVIRVVAGAAVVSVEPSAWILICTGLLALMLAFAKRRHEGLSLAEAGTNHRRVLVHYSPAFVDGMIILTSGATLTAYAAYTTTGTAAEHHLAGSLPFVLYGVLRYLWIVFHRNGGGSPTAVVWSDRPLQIAILGWVVTVGALLAIAPGG
jgi:4-hydroxybenzoate polyprenyltransferase